MKKISFVVPVYNVEAYIDQCMQSLVNQDLPFSEYEIIVVDDGSPDSSMQIVREYAKRYPNIIIITQTNQGLSEARNKGFSQAQGKYVWFVDSDDWITEQCIKGLLTVMDRKELDMFCIAPLIQAQNEFQSFFKKEELPVFSGKSNLLSRSIVIGAWSYIFRTAFLKENNLSFYRGIYYEDEEFTPRALYYANRIASLKSFSVYFYRVREKSITTTLSKKHIFDKLKVAKSLKNFTEKEEIIQELSVVYKEKQDNLVLSGLSGLSTNIKSKGLLRAYLFEAKENGLYPFEIDKATNAKRSLLFFCWNHIPLLFYTTIKYIK